MGWRREYFQRFEYDGRVHIKSAPGQEAISLCCINEFSNRDRDTTKPVTCNECRSIANYCHDHVRLRPPKKVAPPRPDGKAQP